MPGQGMIYFEALTRPGPKTGRRYGAAVAAVRARARAGGRMSAADFWPEFKVTVMGQILRYLAVKGELRVVQKGVGNAFYKVEAIYEGKEFTAGEMNVRAMGLRTVCSG